MPPSSRASGKTKGLGLSTATAHALAHTMAEALMANGNAMHQNTRLPYSPPTAPPAGYRATGFSLTMACSGPKRPSQCFHCYALPVTLRHSCGRANPVSPAFPLTNHGSEEPPQVSLSDGFRVDSWEIVSPYTRHPLLEAQPR